MSAARRVVGVLCVVALALPFVACAALRAPGGASPGRVRFFRVANGAFDRYTRDPGFLERTWMRRHYWRMVTYTPYFDRRLAWFPDAWVYKDLYAIYVGSALADEHPEWILRDARGQRLYIPYACARGACTQYAADVGDPAFRAHWLAAAGAVLAEGYRGLFVDDVNMTLTRVADGAGRAVAPADRRTGRPMSEADWRRYMAEFTEEIRRAFPRAEIVHNALWFLGHDDPAVQRELLAADAINLERGANDAGIRGRSGTWGLETFLAHVDWLHAHGRHVVFDAGARTDTAREYGLAVYLLVSTGEDALGNGPGGTPDDWWPGYDVALGAALGERYAWSGVLRRDFERGLVLVNQPDAAPCALRLDAGWVDLAGGSRTAFTLDAAEGAVLQRRETAS
jgi:Hypothetical glycosyl hydrolase family 15